MEKASDDFHVKSDRSAYSSGHGNFGPPGLWELHARGCVWGLKEFQSFLVQPPIQHLTAITRTTTGRKTSHHIQHRPMSHLFLELS